MNLLFSAFCHDSVKRADDFYNSCRILVYVDLRTIMDEFTSWDYWGCYDEMEISVKYRYGKVESTRGSDAETLDLVTPAGLCEECLENIDLESDL